MKSNEWTNNVKNKMQQLMEVGKIDCQLGHKQAAADTTKTYLKKLCSSHTQL